MPIMLFVILALIFVVLVIVVTNIVIVPQSMVYVIERLGSYSATWTAGLHVKIPFVERVAKKVSLKEQSQTSPLSRSSPAITSPCRSTPSCSFRSWMPSSTPTA